MLALLCTASGQHLIGQEPSSVQRDWPEKAATKDKSHGNIKTRIDEDLAESTEPTIHETNISMMRGAFMGLEGLPLT